MGTGITFYGLDGFCQDVDRDDKILLRIPPELEEQCDSWDALYLRVDEKNHVSIEIRTCHTDDCTSAAILSGREVWYYVAEAWRGSCEVNVAELIDDLRPSSTLGQLISRLVAGRSICDTSRTWVQRLTADARNADAEIGALVRDRYYTKERVWDASLWITTGHKVRWDSTDHQLDDLVVEAIDKARWWDTNIQSDFLKVFRALREKERREHQDA